MLISRVSMSNLTSFQPQPHFLLSAGKDTHYWLQEEEILEEEEEEEEGVEGEGEGEDEGEGEGVQWYSLPTTSAAVQCGAVVQW